MRTIVEAARSQLYGRQVPLELWAESVMTATYVLNRSVLSSSTSTPFELWTGRKPDVSYFKVFGSLAFAHIPDALRRKLDPKATECMMVGYCESSKAYRLWDKTKRRVIISRDVTFDETSSQSEHQPEIPQQNYSFLFPMMNDQDHQIAPNDQEHPAVPHPPMADLEEPFEMDLENAPAVLPLVEPVHPAAPAAPPVMEPVHQAAQVENNVPFHGFDVVIPMRRSNRIHLQQLRGLESILHGNNSKSGNLFFLLYSSFFSRLRLL